MAESKYTIEQIEEELELRKRNKPSNELDAIVASLTNDESARAEYLKRKRFPDNPDVIYFKDEDNDLSYIDPITRKPTKEFKEYGDWVDSYDVFGKIVPAFQVGAEVVGGMLGLEGGYKGGIKVKGINIPLPKGRLGATLGGAGTTGVAGAGVYALRGVASEFLGGPELNTDRLADDLIMTSAFGGIPIGISKQAKIVGKFGYDGGQNHLSLIMETARNTDNQTARKVAKDEFGIDLTVADIEYGKNPSTLVQIQGMLARGKEGYRLNDYYESTTAQVNEAIDTYLAELQAGKYVTGKKAESLTGEADPYPIENIKNLSESVIQQMAKNKQRRYEKLLAEANTETKPYYSVDGVQVDPVRQAEVEDLVLGLDEKSKQAFLKQNNLIAEDKLIEVDVSPIIKKLDDEMANTKSQALKDTLEKIKNTFYDGEELKRTLYDLDQVKKIDLDNLATTNVKDGAYQKSKLPYSYKEDLNQLLKAHSEKYRLANRVYDPTKPHTQVLEKSIVGVLSRVIGDDTKVAKTLQRVFQGNASPREVTAFRRLVQAKDPQAFQNLKHMFLQDEIALAKNMPQFIRKVGFGNLDPRYVNALNTKNKALGDYTQVVKEFGLNSKEATLAGNAKRIADDKFADAQKYLDNRKQVYKALFEPEEFETFVRLMDTIQKASFIKGKSESATYGYGQLQQDLQDQFRGRVGKFADAVFSLLNVMGPREARERFKRGQADQASKLMIDMLTTGPENLDAVNEAINVVLPYLYAGSQAGVRIPTAMADERDGVVPTQEDVVEAIQKQKDNLSSQLDSALQGFQPSNIPLVPPATAVRPQDMLSETILPNPKDRELAERLAMGSSGIGSLT